MRRTVTQTEVGQSWICCKHQQKRQEAGVSGVDKAKNQEANFQLVWKVGTRELQMGISSIPKGIEEGQVCSS